MSGLLGRLLGGLEGEPLAKLVASPDWLMMRAEGLAEDVLAGRVALTGSARAAARAVAGWLWRRNQFMTLDVEALERALERAAGSVSGCREAGSVEEVRAGLAVAAEELHRTIAAAVRGSAGERPREAICGEYGATLQRDALGFGALEGPLLVPILDVGCGSSASLVRALRGEGLAATGVDREAPEDVAIAADWGSFPFGQDRWGTVLSHHALTLHLLHHHIAGSERSYAEARVYRAILGSLRVGGRFIYVPGVPFLEAMLPGQFRCARVELHETLVAGLRGLEEASGFELGYAAHVERLG